MQHIKYGQFRSEKDNPQWENIHHFSVLLEREHFHVHTNFTNYPNSCHFSDVTIHTTKRENEGNTCTWSPSGFCSCYDQVRWSSFDSPISDYIATEILIERLTEALLKNDSYLSATEIVEIREKLGSFDIWED